MDIYFRVLCGCLLAAFLILCLGSRAKEFGSLLVIAVCTMAFGVGVYFLQPIIAFFQQAQSMSALPSEYLRLLLKILGIGLTTEMACNLCNQSGSASLAKTLEFVGAALIVNVTIPIYTQLLDLIGKLVAGL